MLNDDRLADVWVVAGAPGSGKSTVSLQLIKKLSPHPALLDKDTMYDSFVSSILEQTNKSSGEREGDWYDKHVKVHEYSGMTKTAREIRSHGCPVVLSAPFTTQIHNAEVWQSWVGELGGKTVNLVWVFTDRETLKKRLELRNFERDSHKLANFDTFVDYMQLDSTPPVPHFKIDNRDIATKSIEDQIEDFLSCNLE